MPTTGYTIANTNVKMRWKEPYVTEGLNKKFFGSVPAGIYRGFTLAPALGNQKLDLLVDPTFSDHVAVYETKTGVSPGFSLAVRLTSGSILLDFEAPSPLNIYAGQTVIIALYATYAVGAATTAEIRVYTVAEYNLAVEKPELIVLGTVNVPAAAIPFVAADVSTYRRVEPWEMEAPGAIFWSPIIKNSSFEWGENTEVVSSTGISETKTGLIPYWELTLQVGAGSAVLRSSDAYQNFGDRSVLLETLAGSPVLTARIRQRTNAPVEAGKHVRVRFYSNILNPSVGGTAALNLVFLDKDGNVVAGTYAVSVDPTVFSGGWVENSAMFEVPAGAVYLRDVTFELVGPATYGGAADNIAIDDVQVWVETGDPLTMFEFMEKIGQPFWADTLVIGAWEAAPVFKKIAALLRFDPTSPAAEGDLVVTSRDEDPTVRPPRMNQKGRMILGEGLLSSHANVERPRITVNSPDRTGLGVGFERALLFEGQRVDNPAATKPRIYVVSNVLVPADTLLEIAQNCRYNPSDQKWYRDVPAVGSFIMQWSGAGWYTWRYPGDFPDGWLDSAWQNTLTFIPGNTDASGGELTLGLGMTSAVQAHRPRISVPRSTVAGVSRTMVSHSGGAQYAIRRYLSDFFPDAEEIAINCTWDETTNLWSQDNALYESCLITFTGDSVLGMTIFYKNSGGPPPWAHPASSGKGGWDERMGFNPINAPAGWGIRNRLYLSNIPKSWSVVDWLAGAPVLVDSLNVNVVSAVPSAAPGEPAFLKVSFPAAGNMASPDYVVNVTMEDLLYVFPYGAFPPRALFAQIIEQTVAYFTIAVWHAPVVGWLGGGGGGLNELDDIRFKISVTGHQNTLA